MRKLRPPPAPAPAPPPPPRLPSPPPSLPFLHFPSRPDDSPPWLCALVLVTFHLERGQTVESAVPPDSLTPSELDAVCYHAMPDSAAGGHGAEDALYSFRLHRPGHLLLAHVLFRQAPDPSNPRGYLQKALVLVTRLPCIHLYRTMLTLLVTPAFELGESVLADVMEDVASWPDPALHSGGPDALVLPLGRSFIRLQLPLSFLTSFAAPVADVAPPRSPLASPRNGPAASPTRVGGHLASELKEDRSKTGEKGGARVDAACVKNGMNMLVRSWPLGASSLHATAAPFHEIDLATALDGVHDRLPAIWELLALGEPLLVLGSTPTQTASAVLALVGLLHPLPFVGDWRPYFCIQDDMYLELCRAQNVAEVLLEGGVYGVTNNHIEATLKFPHVLILPGVGGVGKSRKPGLMTRHQRSLRKSKKLAVMLTAVVQAAAKNRAEAEVMAAEVRAAVFDKITRPFLRAFDRYLVPTWGDGELVTIEPYASDPFGRKLRLVDLDLNTFPTRQDLSSPCLVALFRAGAISSNRVRELYRRFVEGPVFCTWWESARVAAEIECGVLHRTDMMEACVRGTGVMAEQMGVDVVSDGRASDKIVDLCLRVQQEVRDAAEDDYMLREKLCTLLERLGRPLPAEAQASLQMLSMT